MNPHNSKLHPDREGEGEGEKKRGHSDGKLTFRCHDCMAPHDEYFADLQELQFLRIEGVDKLGRRILRITGKLFPAPLVASTRLKDYVMHKVGRELSGEPFCVVYFHSNAKRDNNCPGVLTLRWIYETIPQEHRQRLEVVYFVHPGLFSRTIMGTVGRFFLSGGLYQKLQYIHRVEFLWDYVKRGQVEVPDFVHEHDAELESRPFMDYGLDTDPLPLYGTPGMDSTHLVDPVRWNR